MRKIARELEDKEWWDVSRDKVIRKDLTGGGGGRGKEGTTGIWVE